MIKNIFKKINRSILTLSLGSLLLLSGNSFAIAVNSVTEVENLEQQAITQIESELQSKLNELNQRKQEEISIVESSQVSDSKKESLIKRINSKYSTLIKNEETKISSKKRELKSYYSQMKEDLKVKPTPKEIKQKKQIFVPPQKLIGKWFIKGYQFLGTLKFSSNKGELVANIHFFKYNRWEDIYNLTYDGYNIAFDYENPYGMDLHFQGIVETKDDEAKLIKGDLIDLNTQKTYKWKAYK